MNIIKSIQRFYTKFNNHILFGIGTIVSSSTLIYIIDNNHKWELNKLKKNHEVEIQKKNSNDKLNVF